MYTCNYDVFVCAPVVDIFAEAQCRHFDLPLGTNEAVACGQIPVDKALIREMLHPPSNLQTHRHLEKHTRCHVCVDKIFKQATGMRKFTIT